MSLQIVSEKPFEDDSIPDQNGQNLYSFPDRNGAKTPRGVEDGNDYELAYSKKISPPPPPPKLNFTHDSSQQTLALHVLSKSS